MLNLRNFNKDDIISRAKRKWGEKNSDERNKTGTKYNFLSKKLKKIFSPWENDFCKLTPFQQRILIKSEIIRTYDKLPNIDKTIIMHELGLSQFSSKWYRLQANDKKLILNYVMEK